MGMFKDTWATELENLEGYFINHFLPNHHGKVCPYYLQCYNSPEYLPIATTSSTQGCVNIPSVQATIKSQYGKLPLINPWMSTHE